MRTAEAMVQDAGGALALSRKTSRDDLADVAAFDAALAQTADEADLSMPSADLGGAGTSATAGGDGAASCLSQLLVQDFAPKASSLAAGDRLVSRIAVAWLDATAAPASVSVQAGQSDAPTLASTALTTASTAAEAQAPATPPATASAASPALLALAAGQGSAAASAQPTQAPANAAIAAQPASPVPAVDAPAKISATTSRQDPVAQLNPPRPQSDIFDAAIAPAQAPANGTDARDSDLGSDASAPRLRPRTLPPPWRFRRRFRFPTPLSWRPSRCSRRRRPRRKSHKRSPRLRPPRRSPARPPRLRRPIPWPASAPPCRAPPGPGRTRRPRRRSPRRRRSTWWRSKAGCLRSIPGSAAAPSRIHIPARTPAPRRVKTRPMKRGRAPSRSCPSRRPRRRISPRRRRRRPLRARVPASASSASSASTQLRDLPSAPTPAVRRDLEITLTPQDLGGLQVKLKSSGDRLELSFVADRGETARMISDKSAALESQLHDAGIGLGGVAISSSAAGHVRRRPIGRRARRAGAVGANVRLIVRRRRRAGGARNDAPAPEFFRSRTPGQYE